MTKGELRKQIEVKLHKQAGMKATKGEVATIRRKAAKVADL